MIVAWFCNVKLFILELFILIMAKKKDTPGGFGFCRFFVYWACSGVVLW